MSNYRSPYSSSPYSHQTYQPNPATNYPTPPPYPLQNYPPNAPYPPPQQQQQQQPLNYFPPHPPSQPPTAFSYGSTLSADSRGLPQYPSFSTAQSFTTPQDLQCHPPPNPIPQQPPPQVHYWPHAAQPHPGPTPLPPNPIAAKGAAEAVFDRFDGDKSGYLDLQEFMDALRALHLSISYHEALESFAHCDANEDGRIGKDEFVTEYINQIKKGYQS